MTEEKIYKGIAASPGISIGRAYLYTKKQIFINTRVLSEEEVTAELTEFQNAIEVSRRELTKIHNIALERIGEKNSKIFEAQIEILNDNYFFNNVLSRIKREKRSASYVFNDEINKLGGTLLTSNDDYMRERFADINDVKNRVVRNMNREKLVSKVEENSIIIAHELSPSDTILFSRRKVQGYATDVGGINSHAAIISRALRIPAVVGMKVISQFVIPGQTIIIDGFEGVIICNPKDKTIDDYEAKLREYREQEEKLFKLVYLPNVTLDGKPLELTVNIDVDDEIEILRNFKECGIGLYRTERLFIDRGDFPTEAEQIEEYLKICAIAYPKQATIRTYDIGGDKLLPSSERESNPFLGWRGIRICLDREDIFREQLRALLIASVKKNMKIMLPMISSIEEVKKAKAIFSDVKKELDRKKFKYHKPTQFGIMIEVPSACMLADELAKEVDFFSIGTNDLIQYLLAVDRGNELVADLYQEFHPAVIRTLRSIVESGHKNKIKVSICGEMASNPFAVPVLLGLDIDELSVIPGRYPEIKQIIRAIKYSEAKELIEKITSYPTETEVKNEVISFYNENVKPYLK